MCIFFGRLQYFPRQLEMIADCAFIFLMFGTPNGVHLFDHLLWPIFQSSITHYNYNFFKFLHVHGDLLWAAFMYCLYTCLSDLWVLPSSIPSRYATNWAILALMIVHLYSTCKLEIFKMFLWGGSCIQLLKCQIFFSGLRRKLQRTVTVAHLTCPHSPLPLRSLNM